MDVKRVAIQLETDYNIYKNSEQLQQDAATSQKPKLLFDIDQKKQRTGIGNRITNNAFLIICVPTDHKILLFFNDVKCNKFEKILEYLYINVMTANCSSQVSAIKVLKQHCAAGHGNST